MEPPYNGHIVVNVLHVPQSYSSSAPLPQALWGMVPDPPVQPGCLVSMETVAVGLPRRERRVSGRSLASPDSH